MPKGKSMVGWTLVAGAAVVGILLSSCSTFQGANSPRTVIEPASIPGAEYIGMEKCAVCHAEEVQGFRGEPHASFVATAPGGDGPKVEGCEACHGPGSLHAQAPEDESKVLVGNPTRCYKCHLDKKAKFSLRYTHPVDNGRMACVDCHDPHDEKHAIHKAQDINQSCFECHPDIEGPWTFPHQAVEEDGCTVCHDPHGSNRDKLLVADQGNLCLRCHFEPHDPGTLGEQNHIFFDAIQSGCVNCHSGIHGSNFNAHLRHP